MLGLIILSNFLLFLKQQNINLGIAPAVITDLIQSGVSTLEMVPIGDCKQSVSDADHFIVVELYGDGFCIVFFCCLSSFCFLLWKKSCF
jgi:hypothetical protein